MMRDFSLTFWEAEKDKISSFLVVAKRNYKHEDEDIGDPGD